MAPFEIDTESYNKAARYAQRHGYQLRGASPSAIVIHSTNNSRRGTAFAGEAQYLYESADVSAHFLISKTGRIVRFLHPKTHQAWHVGVALEAFANAKSIGIELHTSVGEQPTQLQKDATAWLCGQLMAEYKIGVEQVDTHRAVARPIGRKSDPEGWSNDDFYRWRAALGVPTVQVFVFPGLKVFRSSLLMGEVVLHLPEGAHIEIDVIGGTGYAAFAGHVKRAIYGTTEVREPGFVDVRLLT